MKVTAITDPDTALAFRLAGIETVSVSGREDAGRVLKQAADQPDAGIVLVTERLARAAGETFETLVRERHLPLFIEIPDIRGRTGKRLSAAQKMAAMLRR